MWWNNMFAVSFLLGASFVMLYILVDRICRCRETCAIAKAYGEFMMRGGNTDNMMAAISGLKKVFEKAGSEPKGGVTK